MMSFWNIFKRNAKEVVKKTASEAVEEAYSINIQDLKDSKIYVEGFIEIIKGNHLNDNDVVNIMLFLARQSLATPKSKPLALALKSVILSMEQLKQENKA